jgi:hypothetical protein
MKSYWIWVRLAYTLTLDPYTSHAWRIMIGDTCAWILGRLPCRRTWTLTDQ